MLSDAFPKRLTVSGTLVLKKCTSKMSVLEVSRVDGLGERVGRQLPRGEGPTICHAAPRRIGKSGGRREHGKK